MQIVKANKPLDNNSLKYRKNPSDLKNPSIREGFFKSINLYIIIEESMFYCIAEENTVQIRFQYRV